MKNLKTFEQFVNESSSLNEENRQEQVIKNSCVERLSQFFRVSPNALKHFKFDGTDNIKELTKALNSTSDEGTKAYYEVAIKVGKQDAGIYESNISSSTEDINETTINASYNNALKSASQLEKRLGITLQATWNSIDGEDSQLEKAEQDAFENHGHFAIFTIESLPKGTPFSKSINDLKDIFLLIWEDGTYQFRKGMQPIATPQHSSAERSKIKSGVYIPRPLKELDLQCLEHCLSMAVNENVNEAIDMTNVKLGSILNGELVGTWTLGIARNGKASLSTLRYYEVQKISDALIAAGFTTEPIHLRGSYYDGLLNIDIPKTPKDIKRMAIVIEDNLGNWLINDKGERIREVGRV